jgi:CRP-like cAMP-binding protein
MAHALHAWIDRLGVRSPLNDDEIHILRAIDAPEIEENARWDLVRPGQRVDFSCLVVRGYVARSERFAHGGRHSTAVYLPGDMCDLHSVAVPVAGWGITALTDVVICQVPHEALLDAAQQSAAIAMALWRDTIVDASILSKWVSVLSGHSAPKRLAHLWCELAIRSRIAGIGDEGSFPFPFTQDQLAELLGISPMHVNRVAKELRASGLVTWAERRIALPDWQRLRRFADFDEAYLLLPD